MDVWSSFRTNFYAKYFDIIANLHLERLSHLSEQEFMASPHIMLYGNDTTMLKLITDSILQRVLKRTNTKKKGSFDVVNNNNKYTCPYLHCDTFIEIDMSQITSSEKQFVSEFICNHIACTRNVFQQKHVIVLHNVDTLTEQSSFALRRPIERYSSNIMFIWTTPSLSHIEPTLLSRFMPVRCQIDEANMLTFFETFIQHCIHDNAMVYEQTEIEIEPCLGLTYNLIKLATHDNENTVELSIRAFLKDLFKEPNILKASEAIRVFGYKILHFNVPIAYIMKVTISLLSEDKKFKKKIVDIVQLSSELQHHSNKVSKHVLVLEQYFLRIYKWSFSR